MSDQYHEPNDYSEPLLNLPDDHPASLPMLSRAALLALPPDIEYREIDVPEWGMRVRVKGLTAAELDAYQAGAWQGKGKNRQLNLMNMRAKLVVLTVVDENGTRIFSDKDAGLVGSRSASAINRIAEVANELSGIDDEDEADILGESETAQSDDSPTA